MELPKFDGELPPEFTGLSHPEMMVAAASWGVVSDFLHEVAKTQAAQLLLLETVTDSLSLVRPELDSVVEHAKDVLRLEIPALTEVANRMDKLADAIRED